MSNLSRRRFLKLSAVGGAAALWMTSLRGVPTLTAHAQGTSTISSIAAAATALLQSMDASRLAKLAFPMDSADRQNWHWTPGYPRKGLPLREMSDESKELADTLLKTLLSSDGYNKVQDLLKAQVFRRADPQRYFMSIFGEPSDNAMWGFRFEGHHLSMHFTFAKGNISATPMFVGVSPTYFTPQGTSVEVSPMQREEVVARNLLRSFSDEMRAKVLFARRTPGDIVTRNAKRVERLPEVGVPLAEMTEAQRQLVLDILEEYLRIMPAAAAKVQREKVQRGGVENIRFGWAGAQNEGQSHYYRLQGPEFLLDFDNTRESGRHIHSVWRDFAGDFGAEL
ncbi:MAG: DUF3500 domain-containing protein [Anaerolineae bacterium]